jgi:putative endonuclease
MATDPYELARLSQEQTARRRLRRLRAATGARGARPAADPLAGRLRAGSPTQRQGRAVENRACRYLAAQGLRVLACNLRCRAGEIDLVALDGETLVFVEVRVRHDARFGGPLASVNRSKQARLVRAAHYFLPRLAARHFAGHPPACRFDVLGFDGLRPCWVRHAFVAGPPGQPA